MELEKTDVNEELGPIGQEPVLVRGEVLFEGVVHGRADDGRLARADLGEVERVEAGSAVAVVRGDADLHFDGEAVQPEHGLLAFIVRHRTWSVRCKGGGELGI